MFILIIIGLMLTGVATGYLLRKRKVRFVQHLITGLIWVLLFLLGAEVGNNPTVIHGLHTLGLEALLLSLFAILGSSLAAGGLWQYIVRSNRKKEKPYER